MSTTVKTESNIATNVPGSKPSLSIKSIIEDLQDLEKSLITRNELEAMKTKIKKLEEENSRINRELRETEADKRLYYNQFHQNVKELDEQKAENGSLKAENDSLKTEIGSLKAKITCSNPDENNRQNDWRKTTLQPMNTLPNHANARFQNRPQQVYCRPDSYRILPTPLPRQMPPKQPQKPTDQSATNVRITKAMLESILHNPKQFTQIDTDQPKHLCRYLKVRE